MSLQRASNNFLSSFCLSSEFLFLSLAWYMIKLASLCYLFFLFLSNHFFKNTFVIRCRVWCFNIIGPGFINFPQQLLCEVTWVLVCQIEGQACWFFIFFYRPDLSLFGPTLLFFSGAVWQPVLSFKSDESTETLNPVNFDYYTCHL